MGSQLLLDSAAAAEMLGIGERTLRDLRKRGLIRYVLPSERKVAYRPEDLRAYIEARTRQDDPAAPPKSRPRKRAGGGKVIPFSGRFG